MSLISLWMECGSLNLDHLPLVASFDLLTAVCVGGGGGGLRGGGGVRGLVVWTMRLTGRTADHTCACLQRGTSDDHKGMVSHLDHGHKGMGLRFRVQD